MFAACSGARYETSRELFEAVRVAAGELERTQEQLREMEDAETRLGGGIVTGPRKSSRNDPSRRTDARIDLEAMMRRRIEEDEQVVDYATSLLYGGEQNGRGGVSALFGTDYADLLWWRYLGCESWERASRAAGWSRRVARIRAEEAFDLMDVLGAEDVIAGRGLAMD